MRRMIHNEQAQAYIEFLMLLPVALLLIAGVIFFGRVLYTQIALDNATYDGVRAGIASLHSGRESVQATQAARWTLAGYHLDPGDARVQVGGFLGGRGNLLSCRVDYTVYVGDIPFVDRFFPAAGVPLSSTASGQVERYKSRWAY
ncbi:MAG: pilus assembly protein [Chloroflexi bacterium]|nr:pilus assembly protein [Chloroflexota bacterium]MBU1746757.1 pilus assembly protein [Chloroflexota bacterium]